MAQLTLFAPAIAGTVTLAAGALLWRRENQTYPTMELALGAIFIAAPLATFGVEHFVIPTVIAQLVPSWLPAREFITYLVGVALVATAVSLIAGRIVRMSSFLMGIMFLLFVTLMHIPGAVASHERNAWLVAFRDSTFAMGGLTLFGALEGQQMKWLVTAARMWAGAVVVFLGAQQVLHPECAPGVPSPRITPGWVPAAIALSYVVGMLLIGCGIAMLTQKWGDEGARIAGWTMVVLTACLYLPDAFISEVARKSLVGTNYIFDTLLYGGTLLVIAGAADKRASQPHAEVASATVS